MHHLPERNSRKKGKPFKGHFMGKETPIINIAMRTGTKSVAHPNI